MNDDFLFGQLRLQYNIFLSIIYKPNSDLKNFEFNTREDKTVISKSEN